MTAYIFDIDGVITDPQKRTITRPELVLRIIKILQDQSPIAFISGRALSWLKERVVNEFYEYIKNNNLDTGILDNVFISGEFGGSSLIFDHGQEKQTVNPDIHLSEELIQQLTEASKNYLDIVFIDKHKQTQFTVEMQPNLTVDEFVKKEREIADIYRDLVKRLSLENLIEVHEDRIAINVKYKTSNKMFATKEFLNLLNKRDINPDSFKVFGDSASDLEICEQLKQTKSKFDLIYVGNPNDIKNKTDFPIIFTLEKFSKETDEGTLEYLKAE